MQDCHSDGVSADANGEGVPSVMREKVVAVIVDKGRGTTAPL